MRRTGRQGDTGAHEECSPSIQLLLVANAGEMGFHAFYVMLGAWTMLLCPTEVESVACATGVVVSSVASSVDAQNFADALSCTGGGVFEVTWTGSVAITEPFKVSGGSAVNITGASGFAPAFVLSDGSSGATAAAIVRGQGGDGIFIVSDASTLTLNNLVLQEGNSSADGGAIYVPEASVISVTDCGFLNNSATGYGGEQHWKHDERIGSHSEVHKQPQ